MKTQKTFKMYDNYDGLEAGQMIILVQYENMLTGKIWYRAIPDSGEGIPGNLNHEIKRYHGWRGTTDNIRCEAMGARKILRISDELYEDKDAPIPVCPYRKLTVGPDLKPDEM